MKRFIVIFAIVAIVLPLPAVFVSASTDKVSASAGKTEVPGNPKSSQEYGKSGNLKGNSEINSKQVDETPSVVPGEVIVKFKQPQIDLNKAGGLSRSNQSAANKNLSLADNVKGSNLVVYKTRKGEKTEDLIARLESDPNVESVQPNYQYSTQVINSNDPQKDTLWGLDNTGQTVNGDFGSITGTDNADINAPEAWAINEGTNAPVIVAVIDTGVAYNHPDLLANMWNGTNCLNENGAAIAGGCNHGFDFEDNDSTPLPTNPFIGFHGTHVAGIIGAKKDNSHGVIGTAPNVKIMALKTSLTTDEIVRAISFAQLNGAKIINASWGGFGFDQALYDSIKGFGNSGGIFVAAAGNFFNDNDGGFHFYPSDFDLDNIISVAATDPNDSLAFFSDTGAISVDVGAPGMGINSTITTNSTLSSETFETVTPPVLPVGWTAGGTANNWGTYHFDRGVFQGNVLFADLNTPYAQTADTTVSSPTMDLSTGGASMDFWTACDTQYDQVNWTDYMALEASGDGGANYTEILRWDEEVMDFFNGGPLDPDKSAVFHFENIGIPSQYATNNFKFQFRWIANGDADTGGGDGCLVDDVKIVALSDGTNEQYGYASGTSMAAPYVSGLAALIEGFDPALTAAEVKNTILTTGDNLNDLVGHTVSGKRINAQRALQSVNPASAIITSFDFAVPSTVVIIDEAAHTIAVTVPFGTNVSAMIPTIAIFGASISPLGGIAQDFTSPVIYTVTAKNGSTQTYTVTVTVAANIAKDIISLNFDGLTPKITGVISGTEITLNVPFGTDVTALVPTIEISGASVVPISGLAQDFTHPVVYTVRSSDGSTKDYTVTVIVANPPRRGGGGGGGGGSSQAPEADQGQVLGNQTNGAHPNGTLILDGQTIYLIKNGQRYGFRNPDEYNSNGYNFNQVVLANDSDKALPLSQNIIRAMGGTLAIDASDNRTVYMVGLGATKRGFASTQVFLDLGYSFNNLPKIDLTDYPSGDPISSGTQAHPAGALVFDGQTIWWVRDGKRQGFENETVFRSYGFSFDKVVRANQSDMTLPEGTTVTFRDGTLVNDNGVVYIISDGKKLLFSTMDSLTAKGYKSSNTLNAKLDNYEAGLKVV